MFTLRLSHYGHGSGIACSYNVYTWSQRALRLTLDTMNAISLITIDSIHVDDIVHNIRAKSTSRSIVIDSLNGSRQGGAFGISV